MNESVLPRVVVVGGGFAGLWATRALASAPVRITLFTGAVVGAIALFFPLDEIVALANAGTLVAFSAVALCMLILRRRSPELPRGFREVAEEVLPPLELAT